MSAPTMRRPPKQGTWICATTGCCLCSGSESQCDCERLTTFVVPAVGPCREAVRVDSCEKCLAGMVCVDFATGEMLQVAKGADIAGDPLP